MNNKNKYLIVVTGPTAIGKTGLSVFLAKNLQTEIISFDSRQFYKEMSIGTAVPSPEELESVPHHFIQHIHIFRDYSVGDYERDALQKIEELFKTHDILIMTGGSGLYEKAVTEGLDEFPEVNPEIRETLNREFKDFGIEYLQEELKKADPEYYETVDLQNHVRLIRALEIFRASGKPYSSFRKNKKAKRDFNVIKIGLKLPREEIYIRINLRVEQMLKDGLLKEAELLYKYRKLNSLQTVGYREIFDYLEGKTDWPTTVEEIKKNTRRYAKRQLTWYNKDENFNWFSPKEKEKILDFIREKLNLAKA